MKELKVKLNNLIGDAKEVKRISSNEYRIDDTVSLKRVIGNNFDVVLDIIINDRPFWTGIKFDDGLKKIWVDVSKKKFSLDNELYLKHKESTRKFWDSLQK
jgi:hypothetical protein